MTKRDKSVALRVIKRCDKSAVMQILEVHGTLWQVDCQKMFWNEAI